MRKSRYYPFERNRYFYGKLLTVRDFESEQKYFNDKRRMMNRLLFGSGVVTGLQVVAVDDKSISVEMGAAIDALGREIVVPSPVTLKLSMMDGFTNNEYAKNVYVCLAYDEKGKEPVHSIANSQVRSDEVSEYNRILESYRVFIREDAPDPSELQFDSLVANTSVLYRDDSVRVLQVTPRYVGPGETFDLTLRIEKTLQAGKIALDAELQLDRTDAVDGQSVRFQEPQDAQQTEYEVKVRLRAGATIGAKASAGLRPGSIALRIGDRQADVNGANANIVEVVAGSVQERLMDDYVKTSLDAALDSPSEPFLYLARIALLQMGPTYVIDRVEQVPFGEYVYNASVQYRLGSLDGGERGEAAGTAAEELHGLLQQELARVEALRSELTARRSAPAAVAGAGALGSDALRTGVVDIPIVPFSRATLSPFAKATKTFVSNEIDHGLGSGATMIVTSLEEQDDNVVSGMLSSGRRVYFGSSDVFKGSEYAPDGLECQLGTIAYPDKGTFRIGVKVQYMVDPVESVRVRWWAYKAAAVSGSSALPGIATIAEAAAGSEPGAE